MKLFAVCCTFFALIVAQPTLPLTDGESSAEGFKSTGSTPSPAIPVASKSSPPADGTSIDEELAEQRTTYQKAIKALRRGSSRDFQRYKRKLKEYPLYQYLDYAELSVRIKKLPRKQVDAFLERYKETRIADKLRVRWLKELKRRRRGSDFIHYYRRNIADTKLTCYYHYARYRTGGEPEQASALNEALKLWMVGKSQPDDCNRLFDLLLDNGKITDQVAWQRYALALSNRQYQLARYLDRFITSEPYDNWASNASAASRNPKLIGKYERFSDHSPQTLAVIEHGLRRLTSQDANLALSHWAHYKQTHPFSIQAQTRITSRLVKALFDQNHQEAADEYLSSSLELTEPPLIEWRIRQALAKRSWGDSLKWIERLPQEYRDEPRWRYWHARLSEHLRQEDPAAIYAELAQKRSFYGFLASEHLGGSYAMEHSPVLATQTEINELESLAGIQRARELRFHGEDLNARREWRDATRNFSEREWQVAAEVARRWSWHNQSIMSMVQASYWNDIEMRFPLVYQDQIEKFTKPLNMDTNLLLALARQESALAEDAVSPAGACGLMQLMPATAKQTARKHKIKYRNKRDLLNPDKNIELGTHYYRDMLDRFDNNRILATAAYNAGPHRVKKWLNKSDGRLQYDVWVETIPFKETRNYVQNVLAFSAIYAHLMGNHTRILTDEEKKTLL